MFTSEHEIEIAVERRMDRLDTAYLDGQLSDAEYQDSITALDMWARQQYSDLMARVQS